MNDLEKIKEMLYMVWLHVAKFDSEEETNEQRQKMLNLFNPSQEDQSAS